MIPAGDLMVILFPPLGINALRRRERSIEVCAIWQRFGTDDKEL